MKRTPTVVIGLPLYNPGPHFVEALESLLLQTYRGFMIVIVDDSDRDGGMDLLQPYLSDSRIVYERNAHRLGMTRNWRTTFQRGRALFGDFPYFAWASDHDVWHPRWLATLVHELEQHRSTVAVSPHSVGIDEHGARIRPSWAFDTTNCKTRREALHKAIWKMHAGDMAYSLFRADVLERCGVYRDVVLPDRLLFSELALHGRFRQTAEVLWYRRYFAHVKPSQSRQWASFFPDGPPWWRRVPWPVLHTLILFNALVVRRRGGPGLGRLRGLAYVADFAINSTGFYLQRKWNKSARRRRARTRLILLANALGKLVPPRFRPSEALVAKARSAFPRPPVNEPSPPPPQAQRPKAPRTQSQIPGDRKRKLDFIVIGAQRSGTTSLWAYLREHPDIFLPDSKEASFFSNPGRWQAGLKPFLQEYFHDAPLTAKWGKATPQYMRGGPQSNPELIAKRMRAAVPGVRLIAILRDPIERARSAHAQTVAGGRERRPFGAAASELIAEASLEAARAKPAKTTQYLVLGEYGRLLRPYYENFDPEQILVCYTAELETRPAEVMSAILTHIGVSPTLPGADVLAERHYRGGMSLRLPPEEVARLTSYLQTSVWPSFGATEQLTALSRSFDWWVRLWNVVPAAPADDLPRDVRAQLEQHYLADAETLEQLTGITPPWVETWARARDAVSV